jgi:hypothetical protein
MPALARQSMVILLVLNVSFAEVAQLEIQLGNRKYQWWIKYI